jgi:hypothetical protein
MQPVPCWEKVWSTQDDAAPGSTLKVYKWVKTDKQQQFSDDEDEVDVPLAPLPDELEVGDGDEDLDQEQDEAAPNPDSAIQEVPDSTAVNTEAQPTPAHPLSPNPPSPSMPLDAHSPNRHLLSLQPDQHLLEESHDVLDASLKPLDTAMDTVVDVGGQMDPEGVDVSDMVNDMDMSGLGPDGITFEHAHDLTQIEGEDALLGGPMMDNSIDPFAEQQIPDLHVSTPE